MRTIACALLLCCSLLSQSLTVTIIDFNGQVVWQMSGVQRVRWPTYDRLLVWAGGPPIFVPVPPACWVLW